MEETIYTVCAVAGGVLVVAQVVLQAFGVFAETDVDLHDADVHEVGGEPEGHGNLFFGILSFKALCAFAALFGLTGLIMLTRSESFGLRVLVSVLAGSAGMIVVAMLMRGLSKLQSSGTVQIENAVGRTGSCYLRIPGDGKGLGKVTIELQGRSLQFEARTAGEEIPTGARVRVVGVEGGDTLDVASA